MATKAKVAKKLKWWLKERFNPQLGTYWVKEGQLTATRAKWLRCNVSPILLETFFRSAYNRSMVRIAKNDYLTTQQAAAAIGCTDSLVRRLRRQGEFPGAIQFSARVFLFPKKEVVRVAKSPNKLGRPRKNSA